MARQLAQKALHPTPGADRRESSGIDAMLSRFWVGSFVLLMAGYVVVVLAAPNPPVLQDYPDWVYQGVLFSKYLSHHPVPGYALKQYPIPNSVTTLGLGVLDCALGWQASAKVWLAFVLAIFGVSCYRLVRRLGGDHSATLLLLASGLATGPYLLTGELNFELGLAVLLLFVSHLLEPEPNPWLSAVLLLLCFFTHMLACGGAYLLLLAYALQERTWRRLIPALPAFALTLWYALARHGEQNQASPLHLLPAVLVGGVAFLGMGRFPGRERVKRLVDGTGGIAAASLLPIPLFALNLKVDVLLGWLGPLNVVVLKGSPTGSLWSNSSFRVFAALGIFSSLGALYALLVSNWRVLVSDRKRQFLATTTLTLLILFFLSPADALGVIAIDDRFFHLALATGLCVIGLHLGRTAHLLAACALVVGAINLVQFTEAQFHPSITSIRNMEDVGLGSLRVEPTMRLPYYAALRSQSFQQWIFPTALFRFEPHQARSGGAHK